MNKYNYKHITIFLPNGSTLRFNNVTNFGMSMDTANFNYVSTSDGQTNSATLFVQQIAMIAGVET